MARASRSGGNAEPGIKKRKRNSSPHEKAHKVARTEEGGGVAESALGDEEARQMLQVLEWSDSLGLLDRVFAPSPSSPALSLRSLLTHNHQHSLRVLTTAVHNLRPLAAHPRSRPSETASQQLHFCTLALGLLDQASRHILPLPLSSPFPDISDQPTSPSCPPEPSQHRYALVQHLPSGDYWSSLTSDPPSNDLPTGHAELVSILPTPSSSHSSKLVPTLGSYAPSKSFPTKQIPPQRRLTVGSFLDYGPWASFAPSFDHDCELVGRHDLGEMLWYKRERKAQREVELREWIQGSGSIIDLEHAVPSAHPGSEIDVQAEFDGLLPPEDIQNLKAALDNVELEKLVDELLTRNQRALVRLQELQIDRLSKSTSVDETSEEWHIAHGIMDSLETITSLRPRASGGGFLSVIPPPSVLHKLHKTLALEPRPGWHGTLVPTRATALRDDSTVKVRASSVSAVPAAAATTASTSSSPAPTSVTPVASTAAPTTTPYTGYSYYPTQQQAQAYRTGAGSAAQTPAYAPYKPGATSYYQNYAQQQQQYYGQQAYGGATSQQPYAAYTSWFAHAQQYAASTAAANTATTGRGTPQPATATTTPAAAYGYYQQQPAAAQQQRPAGTGVATPVANTVALNKAASGGGVGVPGVWGGYAMGQQPTLPARTAGTATPTTSTMAAPVTNGYQPATQQQSYYGAYQAPQQQAVQQPAAR